MDTPRILAIADVNISAPPGRNDGIVDFYQSLLGLTCVLSESADDRLVFRGSHATGPRLIVSLSHGPRPERPRILIEVESLVALAEQFDERRLAHAWSQGWYYYDCRLSLPDPAGNRVEFVTRHDI